MMFKIKKYKVTFLIDTSNNWIEKYLKKKNFGLKKEFKFKFESNYKKIKNQDIVFILGYTKILKNNFLKKNKYNLVVHESNLPKGKGFAPVQWQILNKKKKIPVCLISAVEKVDSGDIFERTYFKLTGDELYDEIREKQADITFKIIERFLKKFPHVYSTKQFGKGSFYKRRFPKDNELDINKSIKEQFNLLRLGDNDNFPSFFYYKKKKYILKIFKE